MSADAGQAAPTAPQRDPGTVRVMSYNTRDFLDDRHAAARVIRAVDPDVLCLQEVPRRLLAPTRVSVFAQECGMWWSGRHRGSGGTTIFTSLRAQVLESRHYRLRVATMQRTRGYAVIRVALPGHAPLVITSVHLSLDAREREQHATQIMRTVARGAPVVLAGDLNESDSGRAWGLISGSLRLVSPRTPTHPTRHPRHLLDVIFASSGLEPAPHAAVELDEHDLVRASDHRPVWVDLRTAPLVVPSAQVETGPEVTETQLGAATERIAAAADPPRPPADRV